MPDDPTLQSEDRLADKARAERAVALAFGADGIGTTNLSHAGHPDA